MLFRTMMSLGRSRVRALGSVAVVVALVSPVTAEEPASGQGRLQLGAITDGCENFEDGYSAVQARLRQMGEDVEAPSMGRSNCIGLDCAAKLKGQPGFLLGGQISREQSSLWLIDLAKDQVLVQRRVGPGADKPSGLARQAAVLAERAHDPQATWTPRAQVPVCVKQSSPAHETLGSTVDSSAGTKTSAELRVVLAVHAPSPISKYAAEFQKGVRRSLLEMGVQVQEVRGVAPPANPRDALPAGLKELPLVDVQLLASEQGKKAVTPDGAVVRLSDARHATQASIDCTAQDCEPSQLVQFVKRTATGLLDQSMDSEATVKPSQEGPAALCIPSTTCLQVSVAGDPALSPPVSQPTNSTKSSKCKPVDSRLLIAGGVVLGVGLASVISFGTVYGVLDGQTRRLPPTNEVLLRKEVTDAKPALAGVALGGVSAVIGGILVGLHYRARIQADRMGTICTL